MMIFLNKKILRGIYMKNELNSNTYEGLIFQLKEKGYPDLDIPQIIKSKRMDLLKPLSIACLIEVIIASLTYSFFPQNVFGAFLIVVNLILTLALISCFIDIMNLGEYSNIISFLVYSNKDITKDITNTYKRNIILFEKLSADIMLKTNDYNQLINKGLDSIKKFNHATNKKAMIVELLVDHKENTQELTFFAEFQEIINQLKDVHEKLY